MFTLERAICSVLLTSIIYVVGGALIGEAGARGALERPWPSTPSAVASEAPNWLKSTESARKQPPNTTLYASLPTRTAMSKMKVHVPPQPPASTHTVSRFAKPLRTEGLSVGPILVIGVVFPDEPRP